MHQYSKDGPICPYCGHQHNPSDDPEIFFSEDLTELTCGECDKDFRVSAYVSWSWTSEPARSLQGKINER